MKKKPDLTAAFLELTAAFQVILLMAVYVLQDLSGKKAGVSHHLQFRRTAWMHRYLTDGNVLLATVLLLAAAVLLAAVLYRRRKYLKTAAKLAAMLSLIWLGAGLNALYSPALRALPVYPYLLLALTVSLLLSALPTAVGLLPKPDPF